MSLDLGALVAYIDVDMSAFEAGLDRAADLLTGFGPKGAALAATAGVAVAGALGSSLVENISVDAANDKLAAQLGLTEGESARVGKVAGDLYANAYGDSLADVNEALRSVMQNVSGMADASSADLQQVTGLVIDLGTAFDQDVGATSRAVGKMLKTGLAKDAEEALDVLTRGFQTGGDEAGDLLDTFSEYSTKFRDLGISGQQAMGLISQGLAGGARDADTVADALKEISIKAIEGSDQAAAAFEMLGLDASQLGPQFAAGGESAA
ncbi:phage tail tape measure protein, partial [Nocardioides sp.]|uniref:phage tail tape measure protein n=1 Tax=Nocardioides sp. TaxID=35761 RepID=UPI002B759547